MPTKNYYEGVQQVVHISTNITTGCKHCIRQIGGQDLAESINHYLQDHAYTLLHVGTEMVEDRKGNPWHTTVAVLGKR